MYIATKKRLGDMLVGAKLITAEQLESALKRQKETNQRLGRVLIQQGNVSEVDIIKVLEHQLGIPSISLSKTHIDPEVARLIPLNLAQRFQVLPIKQIGSRLTLAMVDPLNVLAMDEVRIATNCQIDPVIVTERDLKGALARNFGLKDSLDKIMGDLVEEEDPAEEEWSLDRLKELVDDAPVVKIVNSLLQQAVQERASDIHVEPQENKLRVRYRVDGNLREVTEFPRKMQAAVISRLKIMSEMDISERRNPQDGRIQLLVSDKDIDLRVSTLPTIFGEKVVMRILDKSKGLFALNDLGLSDTNLEILSRVIKKPNGIILTTGPTGSGKTSTLYSFLKEMNSPAKNIITLEDPVEYTLPGVNQVQVNTRAGLTFASGLRSVLRQDPDVVMVGEIRDFETAKIAVQAAMTGHLVLSTLHTNSAAGTLIRLLDMEIEPFLVASSVEAVIAQRLVGALCPECREPYEIQPSMLNKLGLNDRASHLLTQVKTFGNELSKLPPRLFRGRGCPLCNNTGYLGRLALHEVLVVTEEIRDLIQHRGTADEIERAARSQGMPSLQEDGILKALNGLTSIEEVLRVLYIEGV
ncbi:MAG TPA: ATPase, T2SS/T4P/T4SS family [Bacillota bacterium]|nr:ATPase, T2SS/T4P/T4SS family [Bacillota bacterium]